MATGVAFHEGRLYAGGPVFPAIAVLEGATLGG